MIDDVVADADRTTVPWLNDVLTPVRPHDERAVITNLNRGEQTLDVLGMGRLGRAGAFDDPLENG
ncbi:MAG: hypothetical protein ACRDYX_03640 [Egibacteraceae bacterium]